MNTLRTVFFITPLLALLCSFAPAAHAGSYVSVGFYSGDDGWDGHRHGRYGDRGRRCDRFPARYHDHRYDRGYHHGYPAAINYVTYTTYAPQPEPVIYQPAVQWTSPGYYAASYQGRFCREYQTTASIGNRPQPAYGTACLQPDGSWEIVR